MNVPMQKQNAIHIGLNLFQIFVPDDNICAVAIVTAKQYNYYIIK